MNMYNPQNWYWLAEDGRIYSSAKQALIKDTNEDFIAWTKAGHRPTPWPKDRDGEETDAALAEVLAPYGLRLFAPTFDEIKVDLKTKVDSAAEFERLKYITNGVGQSMTYQEKVNQAASYSGAYTAHLADPDNNSKPNDDEYLLLQASLGIDGDTVLEVAETVTHAYAIWQKIGAAIEATRLESKAAIENAKTAEEAQAVFAAIKWPNALSA